MKTSTLKLLSNPWLLSSLMGLIVFVFLPFHPYPYYFKLIDEDVINPQKGATVYYQDLNSDLTTEQVVLYDDGDNNVRVQIKGAKKGIYDQFNLDGDYVRANNHCSFGDYDQDGYSEVYMFIKRTDSIYLSWFEPFDTINRDYKEVRHQFIDLIQPRNGKYYLNARNAVIHDLNGDGFGELICGIHTGYNLQPRILISFDINSHTLIKSASYGISPLRLYLGDFDLDGEIEVTGSVYASDNIRDTSLIAYKDQNAWLMLYDSKMNLKSHSGPHGTAFTYLDMIPSTVDHTLNGIMSNRSIDQTHAWIFNYDFSTSQFITIDSIELPEQEMSFFIDTVSDGKTTYIMIANDLGLVKMYLPDHIQAYNYELGTRVSPGPLSWHPRPNKTWLMWPSKWKSEITITTLSGKVIDKFSLPKDSISTCKVFHYKPEPDVDLLNCVVGVEVFTYQQSKNWFYLGKYLILAALILAFYTLIIVVRKITLIQYSRRTQLQQQITQLQLQAVKNQLDPHFTFNALNVLSFLSSRQDNKGVEEFTHHFSKLIRRQLEMSDQPSVKLYDELRFVRHYVELQKLRFDVAIIYDEEIGQHVNMNLRIPKMMIHTHVENAIKHGLLPEGKGGAIQVKVSVDKKNTSIVITDNGIGFKNRSPVNLSEEPDYDSLKDNWHQPVENATTASGRGLNMLNKLYDLYYQLYKVKIRQEIKRLENQNGTVVVITIPG